MKSSIRILLLLAVAPVAFACAPAAVPAQVGDPVLHRYRLDGRGEPFEMPGRLDEISGLAVTPDGRLFGHNDARATVHEIDPTTGAVGKRFSLEDPPLRGDFEGLAVIDDRFFLITSTGLLYEFREVGDREVSPYRVTDTGVGNSCEAEGLDFDPRDQALLVACKTVTPERGMIVVHRLAVDPARGALAPIEVERAQLAAFGVSTSFRPSSIAVSPAGTLVLASAAPERLIEVARDGRVLAAADLPGRRHPQPEGLAFGPDGSLYVADEQNDRPAAVLMRYQPDTSDGSPTR